MRQRINSCNTSFVHCAINLCAGMFLISQLQLCAGAYAADTANAKAVSPAAKDALLKARRHKDAMDDRLALEQYSIYLKLNPADETVRLERANLYSDEQQLDEATADFKLLSTSKNRAIAKTANHELGQVFAKQRKYKEASIYFARAGELGDNTVETELSDCLRLAGDGPGALQVAQKMLQHRQLLPGLQHRARAYMLLKQPAKALPDYNRLIEHQQGAVQRTDPGTKAFVSGAMWLAQLYRERIACLDALGKTELAKRDRLQLRRMEQEALDDMPFRAK